MMPALPPGQSATLSGWLKNLPGRLAVMAIQGYQFGLRPLMVGSCKFHPSCSVYAIEAIEQFGLGRGGWLALRRLCRCHPFCPGGLDPVPQPHRHE